MKIKVTQEHIDRGTKKACSTCPVALALREATGMECEVSTTIAFLPNNDNGIPLPIDAKDFIRRFDAGTLVQPFEFELPIPWALGQFEK